jgi:hypothetical protein
MTAADCLSVSNKNIFQNRVLNFAFGGQVTCNLVMQTVQFPTEAVTQSADTEQRGKSLDWHTVSSLRSITKEHWQLLCKQHISLHCHGHYNLRSHSVSMSEVLCFSLTLLTAVSLHCYSFNSLFFLRLFSLYTLGHGLQKIIYGQSETEVGRKLQWLPQHAVFELSQL